MIEVFAEGRTEEQLIDQLQKRGICQHPLQIREQASGETDMLKKLKLRLRDWHSLQSSAGELLNILVMRDLDLDNQKTIERVCQSTVDAVRQIDSGAKLVKHGHDNLFALETGIHGLKLVLHIATERYLPKFAKATIDDYVLKLALLPDVAEGLINSKRRSDWTITKDKLIDKIQNEIPQLLQSNGIRLLEAKDYLRFLAAVLRSNMSPQRLAAQTLSHAEEADVRSIFEPLLTAVEFLASEA